MRGWSRTDIRKQSRHVAANALSMTRDAVDGMVRAAATSTVRLAVTGLSRAGKTVFTTNLAHTLLRAQQDRERLLPFLEAAMDGTLKETRIEAIDGIAQFPYERNLQALTQSPPTWPSPTQSLSGFRIVMRYRPRSEVLARAVNLATLNIEIVDYPGEWLLDLPLLQKSFDQWSQSAYQITATGARNLLASEWRAEIERMRPDMPYVDSAHLTADVGRVSLLYIQYLKACAAESPGLKLLQPGRFITGFGEFTGNADDFLFCPLPPANDAVGMRSVRTGIAGAVARGRDVISRKPVTLTLRTAMKQRFERYKTEIIEPFYRNHFRRFERQIVLADILTTLNTSHECFYDARDALRDIMDSFRFGRGSRLAGLLAGQIGARIDRVLFAATKADHVTRNQHANLENLLEAMIADKAGAIRSDGATVGFKVIAGVKSTMNIEIDYHGRPLPVIRGVLKNIPAEEVNHYPGVIPERLPEPADWERGLFKFSDFEPPSLAQARTTGIPNINLGAALEFLIGEKLR